MRHGKKFNHLGRKSAHRKAMLSNMACSLIEHKRINTTVAKAKALKQYVEPLITKSKEDSTHNRRVVFSYLKSKNAVTELFREVSAKVGDRPGGYTRIIKIGARQGDNAEMAMIELVDFNEVYVKDSKPAKKKTTRRRSTKKAAPAAEATVEAPATEAPAEEAPAKEAKKAPAKEAKKAPAKKAAAKKAAPKAEKSKKEESGDKTEE
jgi:large subunit ribosomal protein L17